MTIDQQQAAWFAQEVETIVNQIGQAVMGKGHQVSLVVSAFLAGGHVLLEDAPGTGKTALARALAACVNGTHHRIQFTPDLLPSDITGVTIYDQEQQKWDFRPGPIFSQIVLADEINRASPKTQSALLEVMEENQVTVEGQAHQVPQPFLVIATQNPVEQTGTYHLPEAQLDRFMVKTSLGYPGREVAIQILQGAAQPDRAKYLSPVWEAEKVRQLREIAAEVYLDYSLYEYVQSLTEASREQNEIQLGISTRAAISMIQISKVWAASQGRNFVLPDDIKLLAVPVWAHRIIVDPEARFEGMQASELLTRILNEVPVPLDPKN